MTKNKSKRKCCFEECQREGKPYLQFDFYVCPECLQELEKVMAEAFDRRLESKEELETMLATVDICGAGTEDAEAMKNQSEPSWKRWNEMGDKR